MEYTADRDICMIGETSPCFTKGSTYTFIIDEPAGLPMTIDEQGDKHHADQDWVDANFTKVEEHETTY
jgi:hypothetical protein